MSLPLFFPFSAWFKGATNMGCSRLIHRPGSNNQGQIHLVPQFAWADCESRPVLTNANGIPRFVVLVLEAMPRTTAWSSMRVDGEIHNTSLHLNELQFHVLWCYDFVVLFFTWCHFVLYVPYIKEYFRLFRASKRLSQFSTTSRVGHLVVLHSFIRKRSEKHFIPSRYITPRHSIVPNLSKNVC